MDFNSCNISKAMSDCMAMEHLLKFLQQSFIVIWHIFMNQSLTKPPFLAADSIDNYFASVNFYHTTIICNVQLRKLFNLLLILMICVLGSISRWDFTFHYDMTLIGFNKILLNEDSQSSKNFIFIHNCLYRDDVILRDNFPKT